MPCCTFVADRSPRRCTRNLLAVFACAALLLTRAARAQDASNASTPRACIEHFQSALKEGDLDRASTLLDLSEIPPGATAEIGERVALSLGLVLSSLAPVAWTDPSTLDAQTHPTTIELARTAAGAIHIALIDPAGKAPNWKFSAQSVEGTDAQLRLAIPRIRSDIAEGRSSFSSFDSEAPEVALAVAMPDSLRTHALGLSLVQWIGIPFVLVLSLLGARLFRVLFDALLRLLGRHRAAAWRDECARASQAFAWMIALKIGTWLVLGLGLPIPVLLILLLALKIATIASFAWALVEVVALIRAWVASPQGVQMDDLAARGIARIAQIAIVAGALLAVVGTIGERDSVNHAVAALGIGGIAIGLAVQDPLKNYFAGLVLAADRPFRLGDRVTIDSLSGTIVHVGMRATAIRTDFNSVISVPNATVASAKIESEPPGGKDNEIHFSLLLPLTVRADRIAAFRDAARVALAQMPGLRVETIEIGLRGNIDKGIEFGITLSADPAAGKKSAVQDAVMLVLLTEARKAGVMESAIS